LQDAAACVGDLAGLSLDDALFAMTAGDVETTDRALELALAEGATPVGILRAAIFHMQRLHIARLAIDQGSSVEEAIKSSRPPVFFRRAAAFRRALSLWKSEAIGEALAALGRAELACKQTGAPAEAICRHNLFSCAVKYPR
jgi:DNA polymerase-3 subunit delta